MDHAGGANLRLVPRETVAEPAPKPHDSIDEDALTLAGKADDLATRIRARVDRRNEEGGDAGVDRHCSDR